MLLGIGGTCFLWYLFASRIKANNLHKLVSFVSNIRLETIVYNVVSASLIPENYKAVLDYQQNRDDRFSSLCNIILEYESRWLRFCAIYMLHL